MTVIFERGRSGAWRNVGNADAVQHGFGSIRLVACAMVGDELWIGAPGSDGTGRIYRARHDKDGNWTSMTKLVRRFGRCRRAILRVVRRCR